MIRTRLYTAITLLAILVLGLWLLTQGDYRVPLGDVLASLTGSEGGLGSYFVREVRAPRVVAALLVGAALGISGAIFQTLTGNPLGSPDVIGFTTGAATGALVSIILLGSTPLGIGLGAVLGGAATSLLVYLFTRKTGLIGFQLILVGLGLGATLSALNSLMIVRASLTEAQTAASWLVGSLNTMTWDKVLLMSSLLVLLLPFLVWLSRPLRALIFGDTVATGVGVPVPLVRLASLVIGVLLVSVATAVTGPIAFVALASPHLARHLTGQSAGNLGTAASTGALLTLASDALGLYAFPAPLQVGVVTGALGGLYLIYLMYRSRNEVAHD